MHWNCDRVILEQLNRLNVVRMGVGADNQIDVADGQVQLLETLLNMVEQFVWPGSINTRVGPSMK